MPLQDVASGCMVVGEKIQINTKQVSVIKLLGEGERINGGKRDRDVYISLLWDTNSGLTMLVIVL